MPFSFRILINLLSGAKTASMRLDMLSQNIQNHKEQKNWRTQNISCAAEVNAITKSKHDRLLLTPVPPMTNNLHHDKQQVGKRAKTFV